MISGLPPFSLLSGQERWSWQSGRSVYTHAHPGPSIFHPCFGNIDIGRRAADIGDVMMQLKLEAFYYYWHAYITPPLYFRRQIWFGIHQQNPGTSVHIIKKFILSFLVHPSLYRSKGIAGADAFLMHWKNRLCDLVIAVLTAFKRWCVLRGV